MFEQPAEVFLALDSSSRERDRRQLVRDGNVIKIIDRERFHDATNVGPLGTPYWGVAARASYRGFYYDAADRLTTSIDVGTNGAVEWQRPATATDSKNYPTSAVLFRPEQKSKVRTLRHIIDRLASRVHYEQLSHAQN